MPFLGPFRAIFGVESHSKTFFESTNFVFESIALSIHFLSDPYWALREYLWAKVKKETSLGPINVDYQKYSPI